MAAFARIGLLGDIHCEHVRLASAIDHLCEFGVDALCAVGDIVDGRGDPTRCCALLMGRGVLTVAGNHERWLLSELLRDLPDATRLSDLDRPSRRFLESLPRSRRLETTVGPSLLCHGLGENDMAAIRPDDFGYALETNDELTKLIVKGERQVLNGHTHRRMVRRIDRLTIVNAGTLSRDFQPGFALIDLAAKNAEFFDVDADGAVSAAESFALPLD